MICVHCCQPRPERSVRLTTLTKPRTLRVRHAERCVGSSANAAVRSPARRAAPLGSPCARSSSGVRRAVLARVVLIESSSSARPAQNRIGRARIEQIAVLFESRGLRERPVVRLTANGVRTSPPMAKPAVTSGGGDPAGERCPTAAVGGPDHGRHRCRSRASNTVRSSAMRSASWVNA